METWLCGLANSSGYFDIFTLTWKPDIVDLQIVQGILTSLPWHGNLTLWTCKYFRVFWHLYPDMKTWLCGLANTSGYFDIFTLTWKPDFVDLQILQGILTSLPWHGNLTLWTCKYFRVFWHLYPDMETWLCGLRVLDFSQLLGILPKYNSVTALSQSTACQGAIIC